MRTRLRIAVLIAGAWDAKTKRMLVYGGATGPLVGGGEPGDGLASLAAFDPAKNAWTEIATDGDSPGPRGYHALGWDPASKTLLLFGGTRNQFNSPAQDAAAWLISLGR